MKFHCWPALFLLPLAPGARPATAKPAGDRPPQAEFRRLYSSIERSWARKDSGAVIALWSSDYTEFHPDQEPRTRERAASDLRINLKNRGSVWHRTHQILGVRLLDGDQRAEVWVRTRTRGVLVRKNEPKLAGGPWDLSMGVQKVTLTQSASERHVWTLTRSGWRLSSAELKKVK